jgi:hypothetical protein
MLSLLLGLPLVFAKAHARADDGYYSAEVPVASQSRADRQVALSRAMAAVLIKVSGNLAAPNTELGAKAQANAASYVQEFRYLQPTNAQVEEGIKLLLRADFDPGRVRELLKDSGQGVWPANRPQVLVWAIEDTPEVGRSIIMDPTHPLIRDLIARANVRGLPVLLPLWDLDDQIALPMDKLWSFDDAAIMAASARYDITTVLSARYSQASNQTWLASWQFRHGDDRQSQDLRTSEMQDLAIAAIDPLVDFLAKRYVVKNTSDEQELLQVLELEGIEDYRHYEAALSYLARQPLIKRVKLVAARDNKLILQIVLSGNWQQFDNALALDRKMRSLTANGNPNLSPLGSTAEPARYQWLGR